MLRLVPEKSQAVADNTAIIEYEMDGGAREIFTRARGCGFRVFLSGCHSPPDDRRSQSIKRVVGHNPICVRRSRRIRRHLNFIGSRTVFRSQEVIPKNGESAASPLKATALELRHLHRLGTLSGG